MFGDIGVSILLWIAVTSLFHTDLHLSTILASITFSLLPDIDMLVFVSPIFKKIFGFHRGISHYPLCYIPVVFITWLWIGPLWATLLGLGVLIHLVHDTFWIGTGITWWWPFSKKIYLLFSQDYKVKKGTHWVTAYYLHYSVVSVTEYLLFFVSLVALVFYLR